jgi:hypothetical protein
VTRSRGSFSLIAASHSWLVEMIDHPRPRTNVSSRPFSVTQRRIRNGSSCPIPVIRRRRALRREGKDKEHNWPAAGPNTCLSRHTVSSRFGSRPGNPIFCAMCGRARLSSDVSEIKLVFSIPPHRPTPNVAPSWNVAPTDPLAVGCVSRTNRIKGGHDRTPTR